MMISNFNKLIQSKIVWGLFIGLVVFAFVAMDMATPDNNTAQKKNEVVGKVQGNEIKYNELMRSFYSASLDYTLRSGQELRITDQVEQELTNAAWERIAVLKKAENGQYEVTDEEIIERIKDIIRYISQSDQYDPEIYNAFINNLLPRYGMNAKSFDVFIKETIMIEKVLEDIDENLLFIDESEIKEAFHNLNDTLSVQYTLIKRDEFKSNPVSEQKCFTFFTNNYERFRIPEKVIVDYVKFPFVNYTNMVEVSSSMIEMSYSNNLDRFKIDAENDEISYKQLDEVYDEIKNQLLISLARDMAIENAYDFVGDISENNANFSNVAKNQEIEIFTTKSFSMNEQVEPNETSRRFNQAAFNLDLTLENYYSDPIIEERNIYIVALKEKVDSFIPSYEEVKEQVNNATQQVADNDEYLKHTHNIFMDIQNKILDKNLFTDAALEHGLETINCKKFSLNNPLEDDFSREIMSNMYNAQEKVVKSINCKDGVIIAYLLDREKADASLLDEQRLEISAQLRQQRTLELFRNRKQEIVNDASIEIF